MAAELHLFLELIAMSSLCGWAACLALGFSLFSPAKSMIVGAAGILVGSVLWQLTGFPFGPSLSGFPVLSSLAGALVTAVAVETARHLWDGTLTIKHIPRSVRQAGGPLVLKDSPASPPSEAPSRTAPEECPDPPAVQQTGA
ncbi:MAG: hypothetical protein ACREQQ_14425 [Candidatus Binatia bacterium]